MLFSTNVLLFGQGENIKYSKCFFHFSPILHQYDTLFNTEQDIDCVIIMKQHILISCYIIIGLFIHTYSFFLAAKNSQRLRTNEGTVPRRCEVQTFAGNISSYDHLV